MPASKADDGTEKAANASPDPGSRLRQAREAQGLSLEELGNELRIGAAALAALEENRFEALGAAVFAKGYLKQYGTRLGLDVRELADLYERAEGKPQVEIAPSRGIDMREGRPAARWLVRTLLLVIVVGGAAYWWWYRTPAEPATTAGEADVSEPSPSAGVADAEPVVAEPEVTERAPDEPAAPAVAPESEAGLEAGAGEVPDPGAPPPAGLTDGTEGGADEVAPGEIAAGEFAAAPDPLLPANSEPIALAGAAEAAETDGPAIEVHFLDDSWAEITDEDGTRLYYDLGRPGTRVRFPADRNLNFSFGEGAPVELFIDGEPVPVPGAGEREVVRFTFDDLRN